MRTGAAEALYDVLLVNDSLCDDDEEASEEAQVPHSGPACHSDDPALCMQEILLETPWESDLKEIAEPQARLTQLLALGDEE